MSTDSLPSWKSRPSKTYKPKHRNPSSFREVVLQTHQETTGELIVMLLSSRWKKVVLRRSTGTSATTPANFGKYVLVGELPQPANEDR